MTRYLITCKSNPDAPWPTDPKEYSQFMEQVWAGFDDSIKRGIIKEIGFFLDGGWDGFVIVEGEGVDILKGNIGFFPYWLTKTREIVSLENAKEISREIMQSQIETTV